MGWTFKRDASKADIIRECLESWDNTVTEENKAYTDKPLGTRIRSEVLRYRVIGNNLWAVRETTYTAPDGKTEKRLWIALSLLDREPGYGWGHKDLDESMGPAETNCPVEFLDAVPLPEGPYAAKWREEVRGATLAGLPLFGVARVEPQMSLFKTA